MKKLLFFVFLFVACFLFVNNEFQLTTASAQTENNARRSADPNDLLMADTVKRLTNRSTEGLVQKREVSGKGFSIDLDDRFQNMMPSKIDTDGEPVAACVTSVDDA